MESGECNIGCRTLTCPPKTGPDVEVYSGPRLREAGYEEERVHAGTDHQMLREAEVLLAQGSTAADAPRKLGITEQTYYRKLYIAMDQRR